MNVQQNKREKYFDLINTMMLGNFTLRKVFCSRCKKYCTLKDKWENVMIKVKYICKRQVGKSGDDFKAQDEVKFT